MESIKKIGIIEDPKIKGWLNSFFSDDSGIIYHSTSQSVLQELFNNPYQLVFVEKLTLGIYEAMLQSLQTQRNKSWSHIAILIAEPSSSPPYEKLEALNIFSVQPALKTTESFKLTIHWATQCIQRSIRSARLEGDDQHVQQTINSLIQIGNSLSSYSDLDSLLEFLLNQIRAITLADAGSIYLTQTFNNPDTTDSTTGDSEEKKLVFKIAQNDSKQFYLKDQLKDRTLPITINNLAGYVALTGKSLNIEDAYQIPKELGFTFYKDIDQFTGYRSKSFLIVPMKNNKDEVIGVLQLINRKRDKDTILSDPDVTYREVIPFDEKIQGLAQAIASQAAIVIENFHLIKNIQELFNQFALVMIQAVDLRDPYMRGHSERVAYLAIALAKSINETNEGKYKETGYSEENLTELHFAALLHDVGKIAVPEQIIQKSRRLFDSDVEVLKERFVVLRQSLECSFPSNAYRKSLLEAIPEKHDGKHAKSVEEMQTMFEKLIELAYPTPLSDNQKEIVQEFANVQLYNYKNELRGFLDAHEQENFLIERGTLNAEERKIMQTHPYKSWEFLSKIQWTKPLRHVPEIAYAHHEYPNGKGYPRGLSEDEIPLSSKIICLVDIFDALVSADRPYKPAYSIDHALSIMEKEANEGKIDPELLKIFIQHKIFSLHTQKEIK